VWSLRNIVITNPSKHWQVITYVSSNRSVRDNQTSKTASGNHQWKWVYVITSQCMHPASWSLQRNARASPPMPDDVTASGKSTEVQGSTSDSTVVTKAQTAVMVRQVGGGSRRRRWFAVGKAWKKTVLGKICTDYRSSLVPKAFISEDVDCHWPSRNPADVLALKPQDDGVESGDRRLRKPRIKVAPNHPSLPPLRSGDFLRAESSPPLHCWWLSLPPWAWPWRARRPWWTFFPSSPARERGVLDESRHWRSEATKER
jgi:hypothetical protein